MKNAVQLFAVISSIVVTISSQSPITDEESASFETIEIPDDEDQPSSKSEETVASFRAPKEDHITILGFIEKVLSTAQHQSQVAVRRAKKRAELTRAIRVDAERLIEEAEEAKKQIETARRNRLHKRTKRIDSLENVIEEA